ncbi:MAG: hypothetical protein ABIE42_09550 [Candidatus Eisenbacteria bacterium]
MSECHKLGRFVRHSGVMLAATAILVVAGTGCHSGPSGPSGIDCYFTGITEVTADGIVISEDPDDWCSGEIFESYILFGYPNPVTDITKIAYSTPVEGPVRIRVIAQGCIPVRTLLDTELDAGSTGFVVWNCTNESGTRVRPGIYRCLLEADGLQCYGDLMVLDQHASVGG